MQLQYYPPSLLSNPAVLRNKFQFGPKDNHRFFDQVIKDGKNTKKFLNIDYIFVSDQYRKEKLKIGNKRLPDYLVLAIISLATDLSRTVPLSFIAAEPAHKDIIRLYKDNKFDQLEGYDPGILYFKLPE